MFRIYKGDTVIIEGESPLAITGLDPNTDVEKGEYQVVRVDGDKESDRVDIPAFTTLSVVNSRETLVEAINKAGAGDTVTIDEGFIINKDMATNKNIKIVGNGKRKQENKPEEEVKESALRITKVDERVKNINIELSKGNNQSF